ncbi:MAG TPA: hypothetical protein PK448_07220 [Bacteroidales bacterium]|nr:hypothetical protein [Bacteroidales bacterium]
MPPRFARGRRTAASTRAGNVGSQSRKKSFLWSLFCGSVPSASRPCGLSASRLTQPKLKVKRRAESGKLISWK